MAAQEYLTTGQVCKRLDCAEHQARRAIDALEQRGKIRVVRAVAYRLIRVEDIGKVEAELKRRGWLNAVGV